MNRQRKVNVGMVSVHHQNNIDKAAGVSLADYRLQYPAFFLQIICVYFTDCQ